MLWAKAHAPGCAEGIALCFALKGPQQLGCMVEAKPLPRIAHLSNLKRRKQPLSAHAKPGNYSP